MKPETLTAPGADPNRQDPETNREAAEYSTLAAPPPVEAAQIPEASTWMLLIVASALWLLRLRRRATRRSRSNLL